MRVQLVKHWGGWKPGRVFCEMPVGQAQILVKRGFAVEQTAEPPEQDQSKKVTSKPPRKGRKH